MKEEEKEGKRAKKSPAEGISGSNIIDTEGGKTSCHT